MKILVVSDIHLGREDSKIKDLYNFLNDKFFDKIVFNGDIWDQFAWWKDKGKLYRKEHKKLVKDLRKKFKKEKTKVIYTVGNHDWFGLFLIPFGFLFNAKIRKRYKFKDYIFEHGDWIGLYIAIRRIFSKKSKITFENVDFKDYWNMIGVAKEKMIVVGHSHEPEMRGNVIDEGDWVKHNSYAIIEIKDNEEDKIELKNILI